MRLLIQLLALAFALVIGGLSGLDIAHYGLTVAGVFGVLIAVLFIIAIVGAITHRPDE